MLLFLCFTLVLPFFSFYVPTVQANPDEWVDPTGFIDEGGWSSETNAYDNDVGTSAYHGWGHPTQYLQLTLDGPIVSTKIRFYVKGGSGHTMYISVYDGESWTEVYSETAPTDTWTNVTYSEQTVTKAKIKFHTDWSCYIREFDFWEVAQPQEYNRTASLNLTTSWVADKFTLSEYAKKGFVFAAIIVGIFVAVPMVILVLVKRK